MGALDPVYYHPAQSLPARINRQLTQWKAVVPMPKTPDRPIVSFAFDDFPISAAENGTRALEDVNAKATFYVCSGLAGHTTMLGKMYTADTLIDLHKSGHDIAAHSHAHLDCGVANSRTIQVDLTQNLVALRDFIDASAPRHYAWPYGETQPEVKLALKDSMATARGMQAGINRKGSDMMQLRAYGITPDEQSVERAEQAIGKVSRTNGWVIIFTHDVCKTPSALGATPNTISYLAKLARDAGAEILTVSEAYRLLKTQMSF